MERKIKKSSPSYKALKKLTCSYGGAVMSEVNTIVKQGLSVKDEGQEVT